MKNMVHIYLLYPKIFLINLKNEVCNSMGERTDIQSKEKNVYAGDNWEIRERQ